MEIKKIENCNYVMFPRLQHCGLKPEHVNRVHNGARPEGTLCLQRTAFYYKRCKTKKALDYANASSATMFGYVPTILKILFLRVFSSRLLGELE